MPITEAKSSALSETDVRAAVNRWSSGGFLRIPNFGDKFFVEEVVGVSSYKARLKSQYEERKVQRRSVAFSGGSVDNFGQPPDPWDISARKPQAFQEVTETHAVPHTERVERCVPCQGDGRVTCSTCSGKGRTMCTQCQGKGYREQNITNTEHDKNGTPVTTTKAVQTPCTCDQGMVVCTRCHGKGIVTCGPCGGHGQIKSFDEVVVRFFNKELSHIEDKTAVPNDWFAGLSGTMLISDQKPRIDMCEPVSAAIDTRIRELLDDSHDVDERDTRILLQSLRIEQVPITEVRYRYAGINKTLWICGAEQRVHAPDAPWQKGKLWGILGGIAAGVAALIAVILLLASR